jgi:hypothetical protein
LNLATLGFGSHVAGLAHPQLQLRNIVQHIDRNLVIAHRALVAEWAKRLHSAPLEVRSRGVIHLEVQPVLRDQGEEKSLGIDSYAAEHRFSGHGSHPSQLL